MKQFCLFLFLLCGVITAGAQTATNFTCNDCQGNQHDLFSELNSGKVIVICWVMPCSSCIPPAKTTYNVVKGFQDNYSGRVFFYMVDDYADTQCSSLNSWGASNLMQESSYSLRFSNSAINMLDYGDAGMPKVVVLGGSDHDIYYNANNTVSATDIQNAINSALSASSVNNPASGSNIIYLQPALSDKETVLVINSRSAGNARVELFNVTGSKVATVFSGKIYSKENNIPIGTSGLSNGLYFLKTDVSGTTTVLKLVVSH